MTGAGPLPRGVVLAAGAFAVVAAMGTGVLPGGALLGGLLHGAAPGRAAAAGTSAPYLATPGQPSADLHAACPRIGALAAFGTQQVVCTQEPTDGLGAPTWEFADPFLRLPRAPVGGPCTAEGTFARDFARPVVHRCTPGDDGGLRWLPDPSWTRPAD